MTDLSKFDQFLSHPWHGLAPGIIGGMLATRVGSGFFGGIIASFLAHYPTLWLNNVIKLPKNLQGLKPVLILPLLSTLVVGLAMIIVIGPPMKIVNTTMTSWLAGLQTGRAAELGVIFGAMMAFDMGGPVKKAAYAFSVGLLASQIYEPMAAVMAEGAIPFAARDPFRTVPSLMVGSAVAGALSMAFGCGLRVPHGGVFVLFILNAVVNLGAHLLAIVAGTVVTTGMLFFLKKPLAKKEQAFAREVAVT